MKTYGIPYQGSKSRIAPKIIDILPPATRLYDLFAGGCGITHAAMLSGKFKEIIVFLFGRKYYANIIATKGVAKVKLSVYRSSFIFGLCRVQPKIINDVCNAKHIRKYS